MYTIYVNDCPLQLIPAAQAGDHNFSLRYPGSPKFFIQVVGTLEGGAHPGGIQVLCADVEQAWDDFRKHFKWVPAAGGAVLNKGRLLCIYRRNRWDLPKGKHESGEDNATAALREVQEETGLQDLELGQPLPTTYHTYQTNSGKRVLKPTYWYLMRSQQESLEPETEEDIEQARWVPLIELQPILADMYPSLRCIAEAASGQASPPE